MAGKFITFEGIDGSGKSTQLRMLAASLRAKGVDLITTHEPGGTALGRRLRSAFLETDEEVAPMSELLLFAADRAQHVETLIKPSLEQGRVVISDRFADATFAYQGAGRGFDESIVNEVIHLATGGLKPHLTVFFDITVETAISRMTGHQGSERVQNRMDRETTEFYDRVRSAYLGVAKREPGRFKTIDANGLIEDVQRSVFDLVEGFLNR